jgi:hypothetical protein
MMRHANIWAKGWPSRIFRCCGLFRPLEKLPFLWSKGQQGKGKERSADERAHLIESVEEGGWPRKTTLTCSAPGWDWDRRRGGKRSFLLWSNGSITLRNFRSESHRGPGGGRNRLQRASPAPQVLCPCPCPTSTTFASRVIIFITILFLVPDLDLKEAPLTRSLCWH